MDKMKDGSIVFIKSFLSLFIEIMFFCLYIVGWVFVTVNIEEQLTLSIPKRFVFIGVGLFVLYLLLSNIRYKSLGALICKYKYEQKKYIISTTILENIIFYGLVISIAVMQIKKIYTLFYYGCIILFAINMLSCFMPNIQTRLSLYLLRIDFKDITKKSKKRNNGIIL